MYYDDDGIGHSVLDTGRCSNDVCTNDTFADDGKCHAMTTYCCASTASKVRANTTSDNFSFM